MKFIENLPALGKVATLLCAAFMLGAGWQVGDGVVTRVSDAKAAPVPDLTAIRQQLTSIESATNQNRREICLLRLEVRRQTNTEECTK